MMKFRLFVMLRVELGCGARVRLRYRLRINDLGVGSRV